LKLAADQNHAEAQCQYAVCLWEGQGAPIDWVNAARYLRRSGISKQTHRPWFADILEGFWNCGFGVLPGADEPGILREVSEVVQLEHNFSSSGFSIWIVIVNEVS
jgi:hypothetical protein